MKSNLAVSYGFGVYVLPLIVAFIFSLLQYFRAVALQPFTISGEDK
jgi:hypothetical protein